MSFSLGFNICPSVRIVFVGGSRFKPFFADFNELAMAELTQWMTDDEGEAALREAEADLAAQAPPTHARLSGGSAGSGGRLAPL